MNEAEKILASKTENLSKECAWFRKYNIKKQKKFKRLIQAISLVKVIFSGTNIIVKSGGKILKLEK